MLPALFTWYVSRSFYVEKMFINNTVSEYTFLFVQDRVPALFTGTSTCFTAHFTFCTFYRSFYLVHVSSLFSPTCFSLFSRPFASRMFSRLFCQQDVFAPFLPAGYFPDLFASGIFSRPFCQQDIFPPFLPAGCFPALFASRMFSRPFCQQDVFPPFSSLTRFPSLCTHGMLSRSFRR